MITLGRFFRPLIQCQRLFQFPFLFFPFRHLEQRMEIVAQITQPFLPIKGIVRRDIQILSQPFQMGPLPSPTKHSDRPGVRIFLNRRNGRHRCRLEVRLRLFLHHTASLFRSKMVVVHQFSPIFTNVDQKRERLN